MATVTNSNPLQLNKATLKELQTNGAPAGVKVPTYNPDDVTSSIVHFGPSNFARAHLAVYMQRLIEAGSTDCGITCVSPVVAKGDLTDYYNGKATDNRTIKRQQTLAAQDNLYGVWVNENDTNEVEVIASIKDVIIGPFNFDKVIAQMASPETTLVTMTITNEGYYYHEEDGINLKEAGIKVTNGRHDRNGDPPTTTVEYVVEALEARMKAGLPSFGIMSLDNFPNNSARLMTTVLAYASLKSGELRDWIKDNTPYYTTMVDRIVPKPTSAVVKDISDRLGLQDKNALATEEFMQLVIQKGRYDSHERAGERVECPIAFDKVGALYVDNVKPYSDTKLRMLNGAHMVLGLVGRLNGETHADVALKNPAYLEFVDAYIREVSATLPQLDGINQDEYRAKTLNRMGNEFIHDELARLARGGKGKVEGRFISPLIEAYQKDLPRDYMVYGLAAWVKYLASSNPTPETEGDIPSSGANKGTLDIADPDAYDSKLNLVRLAKSLNGDVRPMLSLENTWKGLQNNPKFVEEFSAAYRELSGYGQAQGFGVKSTPFTPQEPK